MPAADPDLPLRQAAVARARALAEAYDDLVPITRLREGFLFEGQRVSFDSFQRDIHRRRAQRGPAALTLTTSYNDPYADTFDDSPALPRHLVSPEGPLVRGVDRVRRFELGSREINDRKMDMGRIDQAVELGTTEIWEVENTTGTPHSFHTTTRVRILESGGEPPPPSLCGPKDTVYVPPGETMRLLT